MDKPDPTLLERRFDRERRARKEAEAILERKALELYEKNQQLQSFNTHLEQIVANRTNELEVNQLRLSRLIANLQNGILVEDENRQIVLTNEVFCRLFEVPAPPEALVGADCRAASAAAKSLFQNSDEFVHRIDEILQTRTIVTGEELRMTNGTILERDYVPVFSGEKYLGHLWQYRDVTEHYSNSERLRQSEEKYRGIIENMELGLMEVDQKGLIVHAYPRFCQMVGYQPQELIGKSALEIFLPPEYIPVLQRQEKDRLEGNAGVYELELIAKGGRRIWVLISGTPIYDSHGKISGSMGIHYDITKQKELQHQLEAAKLTAEAAQEAEKQFLANMSHEMRTPLNAIIGMSHLLYDTEPTEEQKEYISLLRSSADILHGLVTDVLDLSKIRAGKLELQEKTFDLPGLVRAVYRSFQLRLDDKPIQLNCEIDDQLDTFLLGDDLLLNQVLLNLLSNAVKFTQEGRIDLRVDALEYREGFVTVQITVTDTGIGIPEDKLDIIFQTFRQVDGDIKRKFGGTGLGLSITRQIVELQGGHIRVSSRLGKGSRFTVELKFKDSGEKIAAPLVHVEATRPNHLGKILVVEDNYMNRKYISSLFEKNNIAYALAFNGREGVKMAKQEPFSLIFMDIQMPEMDGYEATIAIRNEQNPNKNTPIVALTASAMLSNKDKAFRAGMNNYLSKPFTPAQLWAKMREVLATEDAAAPLAESFEMPDAPRLHSDYLAEMYGNDTAYAAEMFQIFLDEMAPQFPKLAKLASQEDWPALAALAHKIKPSAGMVGLPALEKTLLSIETNAKNPDEWPNMLQNIENMLQEFHESLPLVQQELIHLKTKKA